MARGDSTIHVSILGDVKSLQGALKDAATSLGAFGRNAGKLIVGGLLAGKAITSIFDFTQDSLDKAQEFNDHLDTLSRLTTPTFANHLHDVAFGMADIGISAEDVAAGATAIASFGKAAHVTEPVLESVIPKLLDVAEAIHLKTGKTVDEVIRDIGSAMSGNKKPLQDYGITVSKAMNPDDQILSILRQAQGLFGDANDAATGLHGTQDKINANVDNFQIKLGEALEGPVNALAEAGLKILDELKDWPGAVAQILTPLARALDLVKQIQDAINPLARQAGGLIPHGPDQNVPVPGGRNSDSSIARSVDRTLNRNGLPSLLGGP